MLRIGLGYDVHAFAEGRRLVLGGVEIEHERGLLGHSDADVLAHALVDAILGALREGDIGELFPDTDPAYADADSLVLLAARRRAGARARAGAWSMPTACSSLERPKIAPYRERDARRTSPSARRRRRRVGVKATTTEGLGFEGREEGVAAQAVVLLERA